MHPDTSRRAGGARSTRPSVRRSLVAGSLLVASVLLLTWAGTSLVAALAPGSRPAPEQRADRGYTLTQDDRRLLRRARDVMTLIEPPLATAPLQAGGATVQPPRIRPEPTRIMIPRLDIDQDLTELAVVGRTLQVPDDYADVGWWGGGPVPGRTGSAVVVGHVDSPTGPAVFYRLSGLTAGNQITFRLDDGSRSTFAVTDVEVFDKTEFPSAEVYQPGGRPVLHLITCGGSFDSGTQQYSSNVVVSARLVERLPAVRPATKDEKEGDQR